jgi:cytoskeleton protein RodZ
LLPREKQFSETLGQYLKSKRESRNLTPEDLSKVTRIGLPFLRALEEDDFDFFPKQQFIPGFLKAYCRYLELDPDQVLQRYYTQAEKNRREKAFQQLPLFQDPTPPGKPEPASGQPPPPKPVRLLILVAVLIALSGLAAYLYLIPLLWENGPAPVDRPPALNNFHEPAEPSTSPSTAIPETKENSPQGNPSPAPPSPTQDPKGDLQSKGDEKITGPNEPAKKNKPKLIANRDSKLYHIWGMKYYHKVQAYHRVEFESEEEAIRAGYRKALQ